MLSKVIVNARQVGMSKIRKYERFTFKGGCSLCQFSGAEAFLVHFLDRYKAITEQRILRLVDSPEAAGTYLAVDTIARVEQVERGKRAIALACQYGSV